MKLLESELDDVISRLDHQAQSFESQLADFGLARLARGDAFRFFRHLVNYDTSVLAATTPSAPETYLDYFVADSPVDCHRDHLLVGSQQVKVLSMKEPPSQTFAHILGDLLEVPGEFIACLEWQRTGQDRMRRETVASLRCATSRQRPPSDLGHLRFVTACTDATAYGLEPLRSGGRRMERTLAVATGCVIASFLSLATPLPRSGSRRGSCSGYVVLRGEKARDDALACQLGATGLL